MPSDKFGLKPHIRNVGYYVGKNYLVDDGNTSSRKALELMIKNEMNDIIILDGSHINGFVTARDLIKRVVLANRNLDTTRIKDVMSTNVFTIDESSSVEEAITLMSNNNIRRLCVTDNHGNLIGIVTRQVISGEYFYQVPINALQPPDKYICPFCNSAFETKEELSTHIDQVHIGVGRLQVRR
ncbi:MAG: CBS domain-containing protein [Nitrososphaerota archaeon]|nr:CBS domain-containing protein [Nitrososphaerota archaeon]